MESQFKKDDITGKFAEHRCGKKNVKVEVEWELLEEIAHYYQFPVTVFLSPMGTLKGNRVTKILNRNRKFEQDIKKVFEEFFDE